MMTPGHAWSDLHARLHQTLRDRQLLPQGQRILLAVSGGQDSTCLGQLMTDLQAKWHWHLAIAHCDHGWESDQGISDFVRKLATQRWQLPFLLRTTTGLKASEAAARTWRYQALTEMAIAKGFPYVVTAHTLSDCAETQLYNLIRGTGSDGLTSLTWQRALTSNLSLVRPLLNISRQETGQFCRQHQLPVWSDVVNQDLRFARNRIRQELIPYLQQRFNPKVEHTLAQTAEILQAEVQYLEQQAQQLYQHCQGPEPKQLNRFLLRSQPLALQRRVIRLFLQAHLPQHPNYEQIEALVALITAPNRTQSSTLPGGAIAKAHQGWILLQSLPTKVEEHDLSQDP